MSVQKTQPLSLRFAWPRVLNYYLFCRHKRLDPHRIHAHYKKWQCFSVPAAPQLHSGIRHSKVNPTWSTWKYCMDCSSAKMLRTIDPENICQVSIQSVSTSFFIASVIGDMWTLFWHCKCFGMAFLFCLQQMGIWSQIGSLLQIVKNTF